MRYLGIDYGKKRVGVALSDEAGEFALPHSVLANDKNLFANLKKIIAKKGVGAIVLGESKNFKGEENIIMEAAHQFKNKLEEETGLSIFLEPEFMTSAEAEQMEPRRSDYSRRSGLRLRCPRVKNSMLDASAAALILKSYIDKNTKR